MKAQNLKSRYEALVIIKQEPKRDEYVPSENISPIDEFKELRSALKVAINQVATCAQPKRVETHNDSETSLSVDAGDIGIYGIYAAYSRGGGEVDSLHIGAELELPEGSTEYHTGDERYLLMMNNVDLHSITSGLHAKYEERILEQNGEMFDAIGTLQAIASNVVRN